MIGWRRVGWKLMPIVSRIPEPVLRFLDRHWRIGEDPADGWTYWLDASYARWVRNDMKKHGLS